MSPTAETPAFLDEALNLLGLRGFTQDPELMAPWLSDWRGRYHGRALGMASPGSTGEVSAFVALCARHGVPIVPQAATAACRAGPRPTSAGPPFCSRCAAWTIARSIGSKQ